MNRIDLSEARMISIRYQELGNSMRATASRSRPRPQCLPTTRQTYQLALRRLVACESTTSKPQAPADGLLCSLTGPALAGSH